MHRFQLRSSLVLLAISVGAILLAGLQLLTQREPLPAGSSYSAQPDGVRGLYEWTQSLGAQVVRVDASAGQPSPSLLLLVEPESLLANADRARLEGVARRGGTLVLAGESFFLGTYLRQLDLTLEPRAPVTSAFRPGGTLALPIASRDRLRPVDNATPLLVASNGDWLALSKPYLNGKLIVLATSQPLSNDGLRNDDVARFVYDALNLEQLSGHSVGFEEAHHSFAPTSVGSPVNLNQLMYTTAPGRALLYAGVVVFGWLLLSGRRLGPPLPARGAGQPGRTMFEHVQTLAGLYRRARQLPVARATFSRHYRRLAGQHPEMRAVVGSIESARSERELIDAVARADDALGRARRQGG
jgi:uncharacterized protein DUF4350